MSSSPEHSEGPEGRAELGNQYNFHRLVAAQTQAIHEAALAWWMRLGLPASVADDMRAEPDVDFVYRPGSTRMQELMTPIGAFRYLGFEGIHVIEHPSLSPTTAEQLPARVVHLFLTEQEADPPTLYNVYGAPDMPPMLISVEAINEVLGEDQTSEHELSEVLALATHPEAHYLLDEECREIIRHLRDLAPPVDLTRKLEFVHVPIELMNDEAYDQMIARWRTAVAAGERG